MRRVIPICAMSFVLALAGIASAASLDTAGTACSVPKSHNPPKFVSAQVLPAETAAQWTAVYSFDGGGQASVACPGQKDGVAFNVGYGYKVTGRFGHGAAEEIIEISINGWQTDLQSNMNGTWTLSTTLACPNGDPWLTGVGCSVSGQVNKLHSFMKINGPFPVTAKLVPADKKIRFLIQSHPLIIAAPTQGQPFPKGAPVTVQFTKVAVLANQVVQLEFSRPEAGSWAGSGAFYKQTDAPSITVDGNAFNAPGTWKVAARYVASSLAGGTERTFTIGSAGSASKASPGWPAGSASQQAGPPPGGAQAQKVPPDVQKARPQPRIKPEPTPPVALALRRDPVKLLSSQPEGPAALALVLQNPAGNEEKPDQTVELRLGGQVVGRGRLGRLAAARDQRIVLNYQLPSGTGGPVQVEVWVGGQKIGAVQVTRSSGPPKPPGR